MNVKELIEKYKSYEGKWNAKRAELARQIFLEDLKQLDEQKPVKVPQFVAEIIEYYKRHNATLYDALREKNFNKQYNEWLINEQDAYNKVARAWLDGYEVEEEKLVKVRLKGIGQYLCNDETGLHFQHGFKTDFTRDNLEKLGFGWVFDCPGIEIEEVE